MFVSALNIRFREGFILDDVRGVWIEQYSLKLKCLQFCLMTFTLNILQIALAVILYFRL